jgi:SPW repeat
LLFVFGAGSLVFHWNPSVEYLPLTEGILLFLAPWVLGFSGITAMAWSAWIVGVLAFISAGLTLLSEGNPMGRSAASH